MSHRPDLLVLSSALLLLLLMLSSSPKVSAAETQLLDPQYYNIAPCPCDLQQSACDVGCCCDADCSDADKALFTCAQGFYGGNTTVQLYRRCSSTDGANSPDYHPFTCVLIEDYNAYLGLYFPVQASLLGVTAFDAKQLTAPLASRLNQFPSDSALGLSDALPSAGTQRKGLTVLQYPNGTLPSGLENSQMANYRLALPRRTLGGGCDRTAGVLYLEDSSDACDVAATSAACSTGVASPLDAGSYATDCGASGAACESLVHTRSTFGNGGASAVPVSVTYLALTTAGGYQKGLTGRGVATATTRQAPSISGSNCTNSVVEVQYRFVWSGSTLVNLSATVYLAPVAIDSVVTQRFSVAFAHLAGGTVRRSGVVGYEPGASLLGGEAPPVGSTPVNTNATFQPRLWRANSLGGCDTGTGGELVQFQVDATSYCTETVALAEFNDCAVLRERLRALLGGQFPAGVVGIFGSANASNANDWVTVHDQGLSFYSSENFTNSVNSTPAWTNLTGVCLGVPTEVVLTVLYAEQGKANDSSIWQVVAAYLKYKQVQLTAVCSLDGCNTTTLALSTGVQFIRVPADWLDNDLASLGPYKAYCWWDICWEELAYPLSRDFEGESLAMSTAWCVFITLIAVYAFWISRPWW